MFGANLAILAHICDELSCGQAEFPRILIQNDLEGQGQWPPFSIPAEGILGCMYGANLVIPAQTCDELSCGQGKVYGRTDRQTDGQTDGQTQAMTIPLRPERTRGKNHHPAWLVVNAMWSLNTISKDYSQMWQFMYFGWNFPDLCKYDKRVPRITLRIQLLAREKKNVSTCV